MPPLSEIDVLSGERAPNGLIEEMSKPLRRVGRRQLRGFEQALRVPVRLRDDGAASCTEQRAGDEPPNTTQCTACRLLGVAVEDRLDCIQIGLARRVGAAENLLGLRGEIERVCVLPVEQRLEPDRVAKRPDTRTVRHDAGEGAAQTSRQSFSEGSPAGEHQFSGCRRTVADVAAQPCQLLRVVERAGVGNCQACGRRQRGLVAPLVVGDANRTTAQGQRTRAGPPVRRSLEQSLEHRLGGRRQID